MSFHNKPLSLLSDSVLPWLGQGLLSSVAHMLWYYITLCRYPAKFLQDMTLLFILENYWLIENTAFSTLIQQTFIEQIDMLIIIYKIAHIMFIILSCIFVFIFGLDVVLESGLDPDHFVEQTFRAFFPVREYYM